MVNNQIFSNVYKSYPTGHTKIFDQSAIQNSDN